MATRHKPMRIAAILFLLALSVPEHALAQAGRSETGSQAIGKLLASTAAQTRVTTGYDPRYTVIAYPNGDVPADTGVCTDVLVRAFRNAGIDLQKEVHEDMRLNFAAYPGRWGLRAPDRNIDHRRVPNLQTSLAVRVEGARPLPVLPVGQRNDRSISQPRHAASASASRSGCPT